MTTLPPITPAFAWAYPDVDSPEKAKDHQKSLPNPLLKRSPPFVAQSQSSNGNRFPLANMMPSQSITANGAQLPFSPLGNTTTLRQRRKPSSSYMPPKQSLTDGYYPETTSPVSPLHGFSGFCNALGVKLTCLLVCWKRIVIGFGGKL